MSACRISARWTANCGVINTCAAVTSASRTLPRSKLSSATSRPWRASGTGDRDPVTQRLMGQTMQLRLAESGYRLRRQRFLQRIGAHDVAQPRTDIRQPRLPGSASSICSHTVRAMVLSSTARKASRGSFFATGYRPSDELRCPAFCPPAGDKARSRHGADGRCWSGHAPAAASVRHPRQTGAHGGRNLTRRCRLSSSSSPRASGGHRQEDGFHRLR